MTDDPEDIRRETKVRLDFADLQGIRSTDALVTIVAIQATAVELDALLAAMFGQQREFWFAGRHVRADVERVRQDRVLQWRDGWLVPRPVADWRADRIRPGGIAEVKRALGVDVGVAMPSTPAPEPRIIPIVWRQRAFAFMGDAATPEPGRGRRAIARTRATEARDACQAARPA
jgi:hypothetical protein